MKTLRFIIIGIIAISILLFIFPKSCTTQPSALELKAKHLALIDSIQQVHQAKFKHKSDSLVSIYNDSIVKIQTQLELTAKNYNALRAIVKDMRKVKVDSSSQVVDCVPVVEYNASIEQGDVCDEYLAQKNAELNMKDSIISTRDIQLVECNKSNTTCETALTDQKSLAEAETKEAERAKKWSKKIPLISLVCTEIGIIIAFLVLK